MNGGGQAPGALAPARPSRATSLVARLLRVPTSPPAPPPDEPDAAVFRPDRRYLTYLRLTSLGWVIAAALASATAIVAAAVGGGGNRVLVVSGGLGAAFAAVFVAQWITLRVRYDMTWYVLTSRTLRTRYGVWKVHESTITLKNIQDVRVEQGPLQRLLGIRTLSVQTAGGSGAAPGRGAKGHPLLIILEIAIAFIPGGHGFAGVFSSTQGSRKKGGHAAPCAGAGAGRMIGLREAAAIRGVILARSREAGGSAAHAPSEGITGARLQALREVRDAAAGLWPARG